MGKIAGILALGLGLGVSAQEPTEPRPMDAEFSNLQDTASAANLRRQGEAAYDAQQEPSYRTREPVRAAGNSLEIVGGKGSAVAPDKTTRGNGDW